MYFMPFTMCAGAGKGDLPYNVSDDGDGEEEWTLSTAFMGREGEGEGPTNNGLRGRGKGWTPEGVDDSRLEAYPRGNQEQGRLRVRLLLEVFKFHYVKLPGQQA